MPKFLNTENIIKEFSVIIEKAQKELILITPYIDVKEAFQRTLIKLEQRGIEVLLISREGTLTEEAKKILFKFSNLTILQHNTVHAKCYFSESRMIISSLNMLQHSYKNNREMGILLNIDEDIDEEELLDFVEDDIIFEDALKEAKEIAKASSFVQKSKRVSMEGFSYLFLKNYKNKLENVANKINALSENKIFEISKDKYDSEIIACHNYMENVDVFYDVFIKSYTKSNIDWEINRTLVGLKHPKPQLEKLNSKFRNELYNLQRTRKFKYYWNHIDTYLSIYPKSRDSDYEKHPESILLMFKDEVEYVLNYFKQFNEFRKIF